MTERFERDESESLRRRAELVLAGFNLDSLADVPLIDGATTCPACGHGEAEIIVPAEPAGFVELCCRCGHQFIDPTP